ncbi:4216_t:CDS:2 [Dentiscutata heterogama]|uniref:4216_t:CDS:1 n=1 Tax=Dentiscutata heterogama TaxID=1316150 RepID=A0ACA9LLT3_9GLOM|nr:4216_t:CDS:2 [Dentiscutata heterogama]
MSVGPFLSPTHTLEPVNQVGECKPSPALHALIWKSSHCQSEINELTFPTNSVQSTSYNVVFEKNDDNYKGRIHEPGDPTPISSDNSDTKPNSILSFDEWRAQQEKDGHTAAESKTRSKKRVGNSQNDPALMDSIDGEDYMGFDNPDSMFDNSDSGGLISQYENPASKLKEKFNFASFDCGALVLKSNPEAKGAVSLLYESKDSYVLNKCAATKFIILQLCEDILIESLAMANFEFFSSTFKDFKISISKWYPAKEWKVIGEYRAKNSRELQIFEVKDPIMFAKYIRIDFLTHYGHHQLKESQSQEIVSPSKSSHDIDIDGINSNDDNSSLLIPTTSELLNSKDSIEELPRKLKSHPGLTVHSSDSRINDKTNIEKDFEPLTSIDVCPVNDIHRLFQYKSCYVTLPLIEQYFQPNHIYSDESLLLSRVCLIDMCPLIVTESDLISMEDIDSFIEFNENRKMHITGLGTKSIHRLPSSTIQSTQKPSSTLKTFKDEVGDTFVPSSYPDGSRHSNGGGQDSIFKTIMTRLSKLEHDTDLSNRYIRNMLKETLETLDTSQSQHIMSIWNQINETVGSLKNGYERLVIESITEIKATQSRHNEELRNVTSDLHHLVTEVAFFKRLGLGFVIIFLILIGINYDLANIRSSLLAFHTSMNEFSIQNYRKIWSSVK